MSNRVEQTQKDYGDFSGTTNTQLGYDYYINLLEELKQLEGNNDQDPSTGNYAGSGSSYLSEYSNRLFGAPFQLLDSVDKRFPEINSELGNEYLRNIILNSPILHIRPGMPKYTGNESATSLSNVLMNIYSTVVSDATDINLGNALAGILGQVTLFQSGKKLQNRMFGFRETYYEYIQYVNYMCRSVASYMNLLENLDLPNGCIVSGGEWQPFDKIDWQYYRMTNEVNNPSTYIEQAKGLLGVLKDNIAGNVSLITGLVEGIVSEDSTVAENIKDALAQSSESSILGQITSKISSVDFMVKPISFTESLTNQTSDSFIEGAIDSVRQGVGSEIAWITNSDADVGIVDNLTNFLGDTLSSVSEVIGGLVKPGLGGFTTNLFSGAIASLKGQKMIYPKIYKNSESQMNYSFSITLTTPYGDPYNYYMNIIVPLLHLIALVAPRMVTSNTVASPFLVQAYIPGMCTCQLGIISEMRIIKNPSQKHVSVNGYPLTVEVEFTIEELYNAMSISPANDPASFMFNETLNDYLCNISGLAPSGDTYALQRETMIKAESEYFEQGLYLQDFAGGIIQRFESPFIKNW
jgi:hypothetical protein